MAANFKRSIRSQSGQTLIETITAIFILVTGISTAVGLGIYAFRNADDSTRVIVGTSLAREGIEAVKNQRDSNWVNDSFNVHDSNTMCTFSGGSTQDYCSESWASNLDPGTYALDFNGQTGEAGEVFTPTNNAFALRYCPGTKSFISSTSGAPSCVGVKSTIYSRKIVLQQLSSYNGLTYTYTDVNSGGTFPAFLSAVSTVWWSSRHCPATNDPSTLPNSCKTILEMHFTNWQKVFNYQ